MALPPRAELDSGDAGDRMTVKDLADELGIRVIDVSNRLGRNVSHNSRLGTDDVARVRNWTPDADDGSGNGEAIAAGAPVVEVGSAENVVVQPQSGPGGGGTVRERLENLDDEIAARRASQPVAAALGGTPGPAVDLGPVLTQLEGIGTAVAGVATRQEAMAAWASTFERRTNDRFDNLGQRVDAVDGRLTALEQGAASGVVTQMVGDDDRLARVLGGVLDQRVTPQLTAIGARVDQVQATADDALSVATAARNDVAAVRTEVDEIRRGGIVGRAAEGNPAAVGILGLIGFVLGYLGGLVLFQDVPVPYKVVLSALLAFGGLITGLLIGTFVPASSGHNQNGSPRQPRRRQQPVPVNPVPPAPVATTTPPPVPAPSPDPGAPPTTVMTRVNV